jgi:hypothetical protein
MIGNDDPVAVPEPIERNDDLRAVSLPGRLRIPSPRGAPESVGFGSPSSLVENRLRGKLVDRLTLMAVRHCRHREEQQRTRRAVGPHALGFFYADATSNGSGETEVVAATRLFFDNDDNADTSDLITVLDMLIERAGEYSPGTFEPRTHMCNRVETMPPTAELLGIGVTTVSEPPAKSVGYMTLGMDRPYKAVARTLDGTDLLIRCEGGFLASVDVRSTQTLNVRGMRTRHWEWLPTQLLRTSETELLEILPRLGALLDCAAGDSPMVVPSAPAPSPTSPRRGVHARRTRVRLGSRRG